MVKVTMINYRGILVCCALLLASCGGSSHQSQPQILSPSKPSITASLNTPWPGQSVTFTAISTDPKSEAISYTWNFGDGTTAKGNAVAHVFSAEGSFSVSVSATNTDNASSYNSLTLPVAYLPPANVSITSSSTQQYTQQVFSFQGVASDPAGLSITYNWDFGDSTAVAGTTSSHAYAAAGAYTVTLTATNSAHKSQSMTLLLTVLAKPSSGNAGNSDNAFGTYCSDTLCAAIDASTYSGAGIGIWRYNNTTAADAALDLKLNGLQAGKKITLVFTNGQSVSAASVPQFGTLATPASGIVPAQSPGITSIMSIAAAMDAAHVNAHDVMLERNHELALKLIQEGKSKPAGSSATRTTIAKSLPNAAPPAIDTARTWNDNYGATVAYDTKVIYTCPLPDGRNAVFWLDPNVTTAGKVKDSDIDILENSYCGASGANGGYGRLTGMLGDPWGSGSDGYSSLIHDQNGQLQDINIVILQVPSDTGWGGYFYGINNFMKSVYSSSNEALAFFINGTNLPGNAYYYASVLLHESTHMINYYQRSIVRHVAHDTWLEETSAMMTEDILASLTNNVSIRGRVYGVLSAGGSTSLINWVSLSNANYDFGGSLGAFINRHYGPVIYKNLIECGAAVAAATSYDCMNSLIIQNNGNGLADELSRLGASVYAALPAAGVPWGFGFPATTSASDANFNEVAIDTSIWATYLPVAKPLSSGFTATTHTYLADTATGTSYERDGIIIPANTSLIVVVH